MQPITTHAQAWTVATFPTTEVMLLTFIYTDKHQYNNRESWGQSLLSVANKHTKNIFCYSAILDTTKNLYNSLREHLLLSFLWEWISFSACKLF